MNPSERLSDEVDSCLCNLKHVAWGWLAILTRRYYIRDSLVPMVCEAKYG